MADHREEEFEEEEVWAAMANHVRGHSPRHGEPQALHGHGAASNSISRKQQQQQQHRRYSSPPNKMIQQAASAPSGSRRSAPVSIPDWSKIYGRSKAGDDDGGGEDDDDDGEEERVPPHEWLARKMAGSCQVTSFSVCEGAGRTLKGRDLSRLRNAVLSKTGFLEYLDGDHRH